MRVAWPLLSAALSLFAQPQEPAQPDFETRHVRQLRCPRYTAATSTIKVTITSCQSTDALPLLSKLFSRQPAADLVHQQRAEISQHCHVYKRKGRPAPTIGFPADDRQRRSALATEREEHHQGQGSGNREHRAVAVVPRCFLQLLPQIGLAGVL